MRRILIGIIATALALPVYSAEIDSSDVDSINADSTDAEAPPLWEVRLAAFGRYGPSYPASQESQINIVPLPFPIYRGKVLRLGEENEKPVRTRIFRRDRIKLDMDFGLNFSADSDDIDARTDMPDLDLLLEVGPELELQFESEPFGGQMFLAFQMRGAVSMDGIDPTWRGVVFTTEYKYEKEFRNTDFTIRVAPEWASNDYMDFFYGVAPQFATPDRPAYKASSGYLGTRVGFSLKQAVTEKIDVVGGYRLGFYKGAKNDNSPLFTEEATHGFIVAFVWKFWESERRAEVIDNRTRF